MKIQFNWFYNFEDTDKDSIEEFLINDLERTPDPLLKACHEGTVTISLSCKDPLHDIFVGAARCSCGNTFGTINGIASGLVEYNPCNISTAL